MENTNKFAGMSEQNVESAIKRQKVMSIVTKVLIYVFLVLIAVSVVFPFYWMVITSLKTDYEYNLVVPTLYITHGFDFDNYVQAIKVGDFLQNLVNTLLVAFISTLLSMVIIILAAFAFARLEFKGKNILFMLLLATMMVPGELFTITNYSTVSNFGWTNSLMVLIVPFLVSVFYIYLLRNTFKQIPDSLYYAAKVDGTSDLKYLIKVMLPMSSSTIISITILKVMGSWNAYIWPRLVNKNELRLISNWLTNGFVDPQTNLVNYPMKMAGVVIVSLPLLLMFILFRKYIMRGVSRSGIKG